VSKHQEQIIAAAAGKLDEPIVAAVFAKPRGATMAATGGNIFGGMSVRKQTKAAAEAGLLLGNPGAVALTGASLVTMQVKVSMTGEIKAVDQVLTSVPLGQIDELDVKRMGLGGLMKIRTGGHAVTLEGKVGDMRDFAEAFAQARARINGP
jgi:hypothetical protein